MNVVSTRIANKSDISQIVSIHIEAFPGFFLTRMGPRFLSQYYNGYLERCETLIIASVDGGKVVGFVAGLKNSGEYYRFLKKHWYRFVFPILGALLDLDLVRRCSARVFSVLKNNQVNRTMSPPGGYHELTSIAVSPSTGPAGTGRALMASYIDQVLLDKRAFGVFLTTDADDNERVNRFYKTLGFNEFGEFSHELDRTMRAYTLSLKSYRNNL